MTAPLGHEGERHPVLSVRHAGDHKGRHANPKREMVSQQGHAQAYRSTMAGASAYQPSTFAKINGATMVASDSMTYFGVAAPSLPHVIFSFGTAPEYEP